MPRSSSSTKKKDETKKKEEVVLPLAEQPLFPLIVGSFEGKLPGQEGYEESKDRLRNGFVYGQKAKPQWLSKDVRLDEVCAYDFLTNPKTGVRPGQTREPWGTQKVDLSKGIEEYDSLPPLEIWGRGMWLAEALWDPRTDYDGLPYDVKREFEKLTKEGGWPDTGLPEEFWDLWLVSGEGTPSNNLYRIYKLPARIAGQVKPHHPLMWPEELRKKKAWSASSSHYGGQTSYGGQQTSTPTPAKPVLPANVRVRCGDCGHWYRLEDLKAHNNVCGKGEDADWAAMCSPECGCRTLDEACKPKPGFPRPKPAAVEAPDAENGAAAQEPTPSL